MRRRGFTLVEILVASCILAVAAIGIYDLFSAGAREGAVGMWHSSSTIELRNGLRMVREDLARASYPSEVTPSGTVIHDTADNALTARRGEVQLDAGSSETLLRWLICKPAVSTMGVARPAEEATCELVAEGPALRYRRSAMGAVDKVIIHDVGFVKIEVEPGTDAHKNLVIVTVGTRHPLFKDKTKIAETIEAKVEVAVP